MHQSAFHVHTFEKGEIVERERERERDCLANLFRNFLKSRALTSERN